MFGEVLVNCSEETDLIIGVVEPVSFVVGDEVLDRDSTFPERRHDVVGLCPCHSDVSGALSNPGAVSIIRIVIDRELAGSEPRAP